MISGAVLAGLPPRPVLAVVAALLAGYGSFLVYTCLALGWKGIRAPGTLSRHQPQRWAARLRDALGLPPAVARELLVVTVVVGLLSAGVGYELFGGLAPSLALGALGAWIPLASQRARERDRREKAKEAWPRMLEELRLLTGSLGRSIPQALFDVGRGAPESMRPAFAEAEREWLVSTDFNRTVATLEEALADSTADSVLETLLVAQEVGGSDLDRRLASLVADRVTDVEARKDALAKQAGVRFARRFVLAVPVGMALVGLSIGTGRSAYESSLGQMAVVAGVLVLLGCWLWAGRLMKLPEPGRVLGHGDTR